jgi:hypothetical protein
VFALSKPRKVLFLKFHLQIVFSVRSLLDEAINSSGLLENDVSLTRVQTQHIVLPPPFKVAPCSGENVDNEE